jgi:hypothetical protein
VGWLLVVGLATLPLALTSAILGLDGLLNTRGPRNRYVRLLVFAGVLLTVDALLGVRVLQG